MLFVALITPHRQLNKGGIVIRTSIIFIIVILLLVISGCTEKSNNFSFKLINKDFGVTPFHTPAGWDIVKVEQFFKSPIYGDDFVFYDDIPLTVWITFGEKSNENHVQVDTLASDEFSSFFSDLRGNIIYAHSFEKKIADLFINRKVAGIADTANKSYIEPVRILEMNGKEIRVIREEKSGIYSYEWSSNDNSLQFILTNITTTAHVRDADSERMITILEKLTLEK